MKPFIQVAHPRRDVLEGALTADAFAADLWRVAQGDAPAEYQRPELFFRRTYLTDGLKRLLGMAEARLLRGEGDPVVKLQTPFGGGKTHSLIALYHKAQEWGAKRAVFVGTVPHPEDTTPWEEVERQLRGEALVLRGRVSPGKERLLKVLSEHQPLLILIDEILAYATKAAAVKLGDTDLKAQLLVFLQELTEAVGSLERAFLVITVPTSELEHHDERVFQAIEKVIGRVERAFAPVKDEEIAEVVRRRLFEKVLEEEAAEIVEEVVGHLRRYNVLERERESEFRDKFLRTYPFHPDVIDVLYQRWGSLPQFQRTRGVLRLLAAVIRYLQASHRPFIRLGDFPLQEVPVRQELISCIGDEYNSVISADIISPDSGAKRVDREVGDVYRPHKLGTVVATTIFMYSFSGGERGVTREELKLSASDPAFIPHAIDSALEGLEKKLYFLHKSGEDYYYFSTAPNLNRILLAKKELVGAREIDEVAENLLKEEFGSNGVIWPSRSEEVPDDPRLKWVVLKAKDEKFAKDIVHQKGSSQRVYKNTLVFLMPEENERPVFEDTARDALAVQLLLEDKTLQLKDETKREFQKRLKELKQKVKEDLRRLYRLVAVPAEGGLEVYDLGIPAKGVSQGIKKDAVRKLEDEGALLSSLHPLKLKELFLEKPGNLWASTKGILTAFLTSPKMSVLVSEEVLRESIARGVEEGLFGLGKKIGDRAECERFGVRVVPEFTNGEAIVAPELCREEPEEGGEEAVAESTPTEEVEKELSQEPVKKDAVDKLNIRLEITSDRLGDFGRLLRFIGERFRVLKIELVAEEGSMSAAEYENVVQESLRQLEERQS